MQNKNLDKLKKEYPLKDIETGTHLLQKQTEWCSKNNISYTPNLIFNGHLLPDEYEPEDLIYFTN